jgi:hypothetical protein
VINDGSWDPKKLVKLLRKSQSVALLSPPCSSLLNKCMTPNTSLLIFHSQSFTLQPSTYSRGWSLTSKKPFLFGIVLVLGIGIAQQFLSSIVLGIVLVCRPWYSPSLICGPKVGSIEPACINNPESGEPITDKETIKKVSLEH